MGLINMKFNIVIDFVESEAAFGCVTINGFNFQHFNLCSISVTADYHEVPNSPLILDFDKNNNSRSYYNMFSCYEWIKEGKIGAMV